MTKFILLLLLLTGISVPVGIHSLLEYEEKKKLEAEHLFWSQDSYFFTPTSCKDESGGEDCAIFTTPGIGASLLFSQMGRIYLEGEVWGYRRIKRIKPYQKVKLVVEHGTLGGKPIPNVPAGYKLVSCYCNQPECLISSPTSPVYVWYDRMWRGYSFTKVKPE